MRLTRHEMRFLRTERLLKRYAEELKVKRTVSLIVVDKRSGGESPKSEWYCTPRPTIHRVVVGRDILMKAPPSEIKEALIHELFHIKLEERLGLSKYPDLGGLEEFYVNFEVIKHRPRFKGRILLLGVKKIRVWNMVRHFRTHRGRERARCVWGYAGHLAGLAQLFRLFTPCDLITYMNRIAPLFRERHFARFFFEQLCFFEYVTAPLRRRPSGTTSPCGRNISNRNLLLLPKHF